MIRHIAMFRWKPGTTSDQIAEVSATLDRLPGTVASIRRYDHGPDLGLGSPRWDYAVVAEFDDEDGWRTYDQDAEHDRVRREVIGPLAEERAGIQLRS